MLSQRRFLPLTLALFYCSVARADTLTGFTDPVNHDFGDVIAKFEAGTFLQEFLGNIAFSAPSLRLPVTGLTVTLQKLDLQTEALTNTGSIFSGGAQLTLSEPAVGTLDADASEFHFRSSDVTFGAGFSLPGAPFGFGSPPPPDVSPYPAFSNCMEGTPDILVTPFGCTYHTAIDITGRNFLFFPTPVPEPSGFLLLGPTGLLIVILTRRRSFGISLRKSEVLKGRPQEAM